MKKAYVLSYDLKGTYGSYEKLYAFLKSQNNWWHYLASTWLIVSQKSASELTDEIVPFINKGDRFLIVPLVSGGSGWLPSKAWDWIKKHLNE